MAWLRLLVLIALAASSLPETTPQAWGAAAGTVVVAQGVDPTTLDPMNHRKRRRPWWPTISSMG